MNAIDRRRLRILYHHRIAASDGMRVHVTEVVSALREQGHLVRIVGPGGAAAEQGAGPGGPLERAADRLRQRLPSWAFEVLELAYNVPAYLRLARAARAFEPDVLYERHNLFLLAGLWLRARRGLPMLLEVNAPLAEERAALGQLQLRRLGELCQGALWRGADIVLPVTEVLAGLVRQAGVPASAIRVIPNGANPAHPHTDGHAAAIRKRLGLRPEALVLGFVGFVRPWHGVGWAVEAMADLPNSAHLVVVGDGPALPRLMARAIELGICERVHFVGRVEHDEVGAYMRAFDVALQTASVPYASPLKLFEYMALGRAVLAPDQPNIREVLLDGVNALLFDPACEAAFRSALARLCRDGQLRARLGAEAAATLRQRELTWAGNAERITGLARGLLRGASSRPRTRNVAAPDRPVP